MTAFMEYIFKRGGFVFRKSEKSAKFSHHDKISTHNLMAQLEHGRWNAERLLNGWRLSPKDVLKKKRHTRLPGGNWTTRLKHRTTIH